MLFISDCPPGTAGRSSGAAAVQLVDGAQWDVGGGGGGGGGGGYLPVADVMGSSAIMMPVTSANAALLGIGVEDE